MIEVTNNAEQTVQPGAAITFNTVLVSQGCDTCHRKNSSAVKLTRKGVYNIVFSADIGSNTATTEASLVLQAGGEPLPESAMRVMTEAAGDLNNVSKTIRVENCCADFSRITVVNTGTTPVNIGAYPVLIANIM